MNEFLQLLANGVVLFGRNRLGECLPRAAVKALGLKAVEFIK
jgi:hypothetical protein